MILYVFNPNFLEAEAREVAILVFETSLGKKKKLKKQINKQTNKKRDIHASSCF